MDVFVGQTGVTKVVLRDVEGDPGATYDTIAWSTTHPDSMHVLDEDAEPTDARVEFTAVTPLDEEAFIRCVVDTRKGEEVNHLNLQSAPLVVLEPPPGEAVTGEVELVLEQVT